MQVHPLTASGSLYAILRFLTGVRKETQGPQPGWQDTNLSPLLLFPVLANCLAAFPSNNGQVRGGILHWDYRLWLQEVGKEKKNFPLVTEVNQRPCCT